MPFIDDVVAGAILIWPPMSLILFKSSLPTLSFPNRDTAKHPLG